MTQPYTHDQTKREIVSLHPPGSRRERLLVYGESNSGKSSTWLSVAEWIHKTKAQSHMYVLDTDVAWEAMRPVDGHLDGIVTVYDVEQMPQYDEAVKDARKRGKKDDWLVVDMVDKAWSAAQSYYYERVFGKDVDDFWIEAKTGEGPSVAGKWGENWGIINKIYGNFINPVHRFQGHLLCCTPATQVRAPDRKGEGGDSEEIRRVFGRYSVRPQGQKDLAHLFHTVVLMQEMPNGWSLTTVKDRQRERVAGVKVKDFVSSYLIPTAGWRP